MIWLVSYLRKRVFLIFLKKYNYKKKEIKLFYNIIYIGKSLRKEFMEKIKYYLGKYKIVIILIISVILLLFAILYTV